MSTALSVLPWDERAKVTVTKTLQNLAIARQAELLDGAIRVYLHILGGLAPRHISLACEQLASEPRAAYSTLMPPAGDIRALAEQVGLAEAETERLKRLMPLPVADVDGVRFFCLECYDESAGWRTHWCPGEGPQRVQADAKPDRHARLPISRCGHTRSHAAHTFSDRCACYDVNPVIAAHRARQIRRAAPAPRRGDRA